MPHARPLICMLCGALLLTGVALLHAPAAGAAGSPGRAALQVALKARGFYGGTIHGRQTAATRAAVRSFQRRKGIRVDGIAGRVTRSKLGAYGRYPIGSRALRQGMRGWDVAGLQFLLARHGFPSGTIDGAFGPRTGAALRRYERWRGERQDGVAGHGTIRALRGKAPRSPLRLRSPVAARVGERFGPRGSRFHAGIDFPARAGAPVRAARAGAVVKSGWDAGGFGRLVVVRHGAGVTTWYAHLSRLNVRPGRSVRAGQRLGTVGATGFATGPHLHFEVRLRGAAVNPLPALR